MLSFKKAIFRALCLCCVFIGGGGLMAEPNPKELFDQGKEILDFAVSGWGGTFRGDSLEAKKYYIQAKEYFEKACNLNYAKGCVSLGGLYEGENLVIGENPRLKERLKKAIQYYSKACELEDGRGCGALGGLYEDGQGVEKNLTKAAQYISKACKLGDQKACEVLKEK
ncbi:sel1 repeat family protein [Helicobacter pylori]|nr:sel1 repeat family protein [Helicobacter pylori]